MYLCYNGGIEENSGELPVTQERGFDMKLRYMALLLVSALLLGVQSAWAQEATYVFPYEGFRYTQKENETVLTQTNLDEHAELIAQLGTTKEAILASYMASGIVMEVIPQDGGQIAVGVADAGDFSGVKRMSAMDDEQLDAFKRQFEDSGLYESCTLTDTDPVCVRLTSSAMYASMPVYTLRYAMLHLGRLYMITQTIVGRVPDESDDVRMSDVLSGMKLLSTVSKPTPAPTPVPTPTPEPTPEPTPGVAELLSSTGTMTVEGVPAYTNDAQIVLSGKTDPSAQVTVAVGGDTLGKTTAKRDGTFTIRVTLSQEGEQTLAVMTDTAEAMFAVHYEMPSARLEILEPMDTTFTGDSVLVRGQTEPGATVYAKGNGVNTNVKAGKNGVFSVRIAVDEEGPQTYQLRAKVKDFKETTQSITLTRIFTEREGITRFRQKMSALDYINLSRNAPKYQGTKFSFRGKVMEFTDYDGSPCALVCVDNASVGVWYDPIWVVLTGEEELKVGHVATFYMTGEGLTLPAGGQYTRDGAETEAPVARAAYVADIK